MEQTTEKECQNRVEEKEEEEAEQIHNILDKQTFHKEEENGKNKPRKKQEGVPCTTMYAISTPPGGGVDSEMDTGTYTCARWVRPGIAGASSSTGALRRAA